MKIRNLTLTLIDEANVTASFDIIKNDGTLLLHVQERGFTSTAPDFATAKAEIKASIRNIRDSYVAQKQSKLANAFASLVGQDTDIEA